MIATEDCVFDLMDRRYMRRAIVLARRGLGHVSPNPPVGCVIARGNRVLAQGWHARFGGPHAEAAALAALAAKGIDAKGATAYVTLMPCAHFGKTPPCADALVRAGIGRVVVAAADPNPTARGGDAVLRAAGIHVESGLLADAAAEVMRGYLRHLAVGRPFLTLKYAMTLDGRIAAPGGDSRWISGEASRRVVHRWRARADAVLVGVGTVLADDPRLGVRMSAITGRSVHQPLRVVLDTHARTPPTARLFAPDAGKSAGERAGEVVIVTGPSAPPERLDALRRAGATLLSAPLGEGEGKNKVKGEGASLDAAAALAVLADARGVRTVLCEGGAELAGTLLSAGLVDETAVFVAPKIIGGRDAPGPVGGAGRRRMADASPLIAPRSWRLPPDWLIVGRISHAGEDAPSKRAEESSFK